MMINKTVLAWVAAFTSTASLAAGDWQTTLQARDVNGDGNIDAYYDTAQDVTWLANIYAGYGVSGDLSQTQTVSFQTPHSHVGSIPLYADGLMSWQSAQNWASNYSLHGVSGWRLPKTVDLGAAGCVNGQADCGVSATPESSELAHLFLTTLGNQLNGGNPVNALNWGPFSSTPPGYMPLISSMRFWSSTEDASNPLNAWSYLFFNGGQYTLEKAPSLLSNQTVPWLVRDGDVAVLAVPEPSALSMWGLGLLGLVGLGRYRRR